MLDKKPTTQLYQENEIEEINCTGRKDLKERSPPWYTEIPAMPPEESDTYRQEWLSFYSTL